MDCGRLEIVLGIVSTYSLIVPHLSPFSLLPTLLSRDDPLDRLSRPFQKCNPSLRLRLVGRAIPLSPMPELRYV